MEKLYKVVAITQAVHVLLSIVRLKQGLQGGIGREWLRWESPKVQEMVSGGRRGSRRMKMRQGIKVRVEASIVDFIRVQPNFDSGRDTEGAKRERGNVSSVFLRLFSRAQVITTEMIKKKVRGKKE